MTTASAEGPKMTDIERVAARISTSELERRWAAVRREMDAHGIDALVMQNASDWLGGYVKWFTDVPAHNDYPRTVIFHRNDLMTLVEMGASGRRDKLDGKDVNNPGIGEIIYSPSFFSVAYTHDYDPLLVADALDARGYRTIGLLGRGALPSALVDAIRSKVSATLVDASDLVDRIKAVKSHEEIALLRRTAAMQDTLFAKVAQAIKPGMRDCDLGAIAQYEGQLFGSEQGIFRGSSEPLGRPAILRGRHFQDRVLQRGDYITLLIENNGPGGFYTELARTMVLGKASSELREAFAVVCEAQTYTAARLKPGAACPDIHAAHDAFMKSHGAPGELRLYGHSQGYDMVERPLLRRDETIPLAANMCVAVHPGFPTRTNFVFICDNFLIHHDGSVEPMHKAEQKIYEID
jgi:Xaa-Pro aminopeptidase